MWGKLKAVARLTGAVALKAKQPESKKERRAAALKAKKPESESESDEPDGVNDAPSESSDSEDEQKSNTDPRPPMPKYLVDILNRAVHNLDARLTGLYRGEAILMHTSNPADRELKTTAGMLADAWMDRASPSLDGTDAALWWSLCRWCVHAAALPKRFTHPAATTKRALNTHPPRACAYCSCRC